MPRRQTGSKQERKLGSRIRVWTRVISLSWRGTGVSFSRYLCSFGEREMRRTESLEVRSYTNGNRTEVSADKKDWIEFSSRTELNCTLLNLLGTVLFLFHLSHNNQIAYILGKTWKVPPIKSRMFQYAVAILQWTQFSL